MSNELRSYRGRDNPNYKDGRRKTRLYRIYHNMLNRCTNPKSGSYNRYGGRGIRVCEAGVVSFEAFRDWAITNGYTNDLISRAEFRRSLMIWAEKLRIAGECGGCELELMQAVIRMLDAQEPISAEMGPREEGCEYCLPDDCCSPLDWKYGLDHILPYRFCPMCGRKMKFAETRKIT